MSNSEKPAHDLEDKNLVVITPEDCQECAKFFQFFEIPVPERLKEAFESFQKDPTFMNQDKLKFWLSEVISKSEHAVFKDEVFAQVRPETQEVNEELSFSRNLEDHIASDD